jgi:hypothetical protein
MQVEFVKVDNQIVGYKLIPEHETDDEAIAVIRDLQFFGMEHEGTNLVYDGLELKDQVKGKVLGNIESLKWIQEKHQNNEGS